MTGESVSIDRAAELLSCSRRTIYTRIRQGFLRTTRTMNHSQRVTLASLTDYRHGRRPASAVAASPERSA